MKLRTVILAFLLTSISIFSQKAGSISGTITSISKETLPYASVLLKASNQQVIEGTVTDENGNFTFSKVLHGTYTLEVQYIGFIPLKKNILLDKTNKNIALNTIELKEDATTLDEVVVQGEKSKVILRLGKKVFNVGKDLSSQNGAATDVLDNVPSVNVSPSGVVSLRGNTNVQILINGRRSALTQNQALEQIAADMIQSVEVITNPSAKFDAAGSSGIINIILKKNKKSGMNGQVRLVSGIPDDYRAYGNINYKANRFHLFTNFGTRYTDYDGTYIKQQKTTKNGVTTILDQDEDEQRHDDGTMYYVGTDYSFNDKNTLTVAYYRNETKDTDVTYLNYEFSNIDTKTQTLFTQGNSKEERDYNQIEANYTRLFETKGRRFTMDFQYDFWNSEKKWKLQTDETFPEITSISTIQTREVAATDDVVFQIDFTTPIGKFANVETGAKFESRAMSNSFLAEQLVDDSFETIDEIDNTLRYKEKIGATYVQLNRKRDKTSYQVGLRLENTTIVIDASAGTLDTKNSYLNIFPSATVGYQFEENLSGQLSYSKRISRPSLWLLSPFYELKDFTSRFTGNSNLKPTYTDAFEVSMLYNLNTFRLSSSLYYLESSDVLQFETRNEGNGVFTQSPINLANEKRYGIELTASLSPLKWLRLNSDFNLFSYRQKGTIDFKDAAFSDKTWFVNFTTNIKVTKRIKMQTSFYYQGERSNAQITTAPISNLNMGISKTILKNKGSIVFNASNILNTRKDIQEIVGTSYKINQERSRNAQRFSLSFVYKFNQKPSDKNRSANRSNRR